MSQTGSGSGKNDRDDFFQLEEVEEDIAEQTGSGFSYTETAGELFPGTDRSVTGTGRPLQGGTGGEPEDPQAVEPAAAEYYDPRLSAEKNSDTESAVKSAVPSPKPKTEAEEKKEINDFFRRTQEPASEKSSRDPDNGKILTVEGRFQKKAVFRGHEQLQAWAVVLGTLLLIVLILNSGVFGLKQWEIEGNERVSDETILSDLGLSEGTNLFRYALNHINSHPTVDSRLSTVDVYFKWPNKVKIVVEESSTIGYVYFQGTYLCIDRKGQVANTTDTPDEDLPIIQGLSVGSFSIGECLNTDDAERYEAVVSIGTALRKYSLETTVNEVNVRVLDDIILKTDTMEIRIGSIDEVERKICVVAGILEMDGIPAGTIHIEDMDAQIYIEPNDDQTAQSEESSGESSEESAEEEISDSDSDASEESSEEDSGEE